MEVNYVLYRDIDGICRSCLLQQGTTSLFEMNNEAEMSLNEVFELCTNIKVEENDKLPSNMCTNCVEELLKTYWFITKCKKSDNILHQTDMNVSSVKIIDEKETQLHTVLPKCETNMKDGGEELNNSAEISQQKVNSSPVKSSKCKKSRQLEKIADKTCSICLKIFAIPYLLKQHMRSHTNERPYRCNACPAQFTNSSNLKRHIRTHTGEKPHVCDICQKAYIQATTLKEHKRTHTGEKPYICCYCGARFGAYANHKAHLLKHRLDEYRLKKEEGKSVLSLKQFECKICSRLLSSKGALKTHLLVHGGKRFLCSNCGKGFTTKIALQNHYRTHTGEKPFKCKTCDKAFPLQASLKQHALIHTGERPYRCKICSRGFTQYHQLKYHLRTHSGERPYVCSYCGKAFALNGNLKVHIRTHTGETPYSCSVCGKGFYDSSSMKKHKKVHEKAANLVNVTTVSTSKSKYTKEKLSCEYNDEMN